MTNHHTPSVAPVQGGASTGAATQPGEEPIGGFRRAIRGQKSSPESTLTEFADRNDPAYWKKRRLEDGTAVTSDKRLRTQPIDFTKQWLATNPFNQRPGAKAEIYKAHELLRRGGNMRQQAVQFVKESKAQVLLMSGTPANPGKQIGQFDYFILTSIQMQDRERVDVVETFGAPHIFSSGRFVRQYQFGGHLHMIPLQTFSGQRALSVDHVPPVYAWKSFYDKYLRSTQSARNEVFVRITTPSGDVFDGYIVATNDFRDSNTELTATFGFTMLVMNEFDVWGSSNLFNNLIAPPKKQGSTVNEAELNVAVGLFDIKIGVADGSLSSNAHVNIGRVLQTGTTESALPVINLDCSHSGYVLNVTSDVQGLELRYDDNATVHGTSSRSAKNPIKIVINRYDQLRAAFVKSNSSVTTGLRVNFTISNGAGQSVKLDVTFVASDKLQIDVIDVFFENATSEYIGGTDRLCVVPEGWSSFVGDTFTDTLVLRVAPKGTTAILPSFQGGLFQNFRITGFKGNNFVDTNGIGASADREKLSKLAITPGVATYDPSKGEFKLPIVFKGPGVFADGNGNPILTLFAVDGIGASMELKLNEGDYEESRFMVAFNTTTPPRGPVGNAFDPALCFYSVVTGNNVSLATSQNYISCYIVAKYTSGVGPSDVLSILDGGTFAFSMAGNRYTFPATRTKSKITVRVGDVNAEATLEFSQPAGALINPQGVKFGPGVGFSVSFSAPKGAADRHEFARTLATALASASGVSFTLGGSDATKIDIANRSDN